MHLLLLQTVVLLLVAEGLTLPSDYFASSSVTQSFRQNGGGTCSYVDNNGQNVMIKFELVNEKTNIVDYQPGSLKNPNQALNECQRTTSNFAEAFSPQMMQGIFNPVIDIFGDAGFPAGETINDQIYAPGNKGVYNGGTDGFAFASSGGPAGSHSGNFQSSGGGVCSYVDSEGNNSMIKYDVVNGRTRIIDSQPRNLQRPLDALQACQRYNAAFSQGITKQLAQSQQAFQDGLLNMQNDMFTNFHQMFPGNFPF